MYKTPEVVKEKYNILTLGHFDEWTYCPTYMDFNFVRLRPSTIPDLHPEVVDGRNRSAIF